MLSYRHGYHAGNFADVLKHLVQVEILHYMQQKDKPFDYIDTHAGAGLYPMGGGMAIQNREFQTGIDPLYSDVTKLPGLERYLAQVAAFNPSGRLQTYPGSAAIACNMLRPVDKAWLFELHPNDSQTLKSHCAGRNVHIRESDGFAGLAALLPSSSRRALVLIDPPYELKQDYQRVIEALKLIHRKMPGAVVALWYPVVDRARIDRLERDVIATGIRRIDLFELGIQADRPGHGMTSSGMMVINPPWMLKVSMAQVLPAVAERLAQEPGAPLRIETLVGE